VTTPPRLKVWRSKTLSRSIMRRERCRHRSFRKIKHDAEANDNSIQGCRTNLRNDSKAGV
jgi:hypothetical protein